MPKKNSCAAASHFLFIRTKMSEEVKKLWRLPLIGLVTIVFGAFVILILSDLLEDYHHAMVSDHLASAMVYL